jgi:hypothetical protein
MVSQTFERAKLVTYYHLNKSYIIENFCVNKEKTKLKCDGKCYLKKTLKKQQEKEEDLPFRTFKKSDIKYLVEDFNFISKLKSLNNKKQYFSHCLVFNPQDYVIDIFHPPQV